MTRIKKVLLLDFLVVFLIGLLIYQMVTGSNTTSAILVSLRELLEVSCITVLYLLTK